MDKNKIKETIFNKVEDFDYNEALKNIRGKITKPNILVCGGTGVGKSSLINYIFGEEVAQVGHAVPVTQEISCYSSEESSVVLFDTIGYEVSDEQQKTFYENVINFVETENKKSAIEEHIHLVWYCISSSNKRITTMDLTALERLSKITKVCVVFTQADGAMPEELNELQTVLRSEMPNLDNFIVSTDERISNEKLDWSKLVQWSLDNLDSSLKFGFAQAIAKELDIKKEQAEAIINRYVVAAGAAVATPLPMTDSAALIAIQTTMATHIFNYWGIDKASDKAKELFINVVVANIGKMISKSLLKLIPGIGTVAAIALNGSIATSFTYAFGRALNEVCYYLAQKVAKGEDIDLESALNMETLMKMVEKYYKK